MLSAGKLSGFVMTLVAKTGKPIGAELMAVLEQMRVVEQRKREQTKVVRM